MSYGSSYVESVKQLLDRFGQDGQLQCAPLTNYVYDPATGESTNDGPLTPVRFAIVSVDTLEDTDTHRRALQRDASLDKFKEGRVIFQIAKEYEGTCTPTESAYLDSDEGRFDISQLKKLRVNGIVVAYEALFTEAD